MRYCPVDFTDSKPGEIVRSYCYMPVHARQMGSRYEAKALAAGMGGLAAIDLHRGKTYGTFDRLHA